MSKGNPKGTQGRVSPNRKYVQLGLNHIECMKSAIIIGFPNDTDEFDQLILKAVNELIVKARAIPNARICLAHAVVRASK